MSSATHLHSVKPWRLLLGNSVGTCHGREVHSKRRLHGCGKDYKRGSHYKRQEIVKAHCRGHSRFDAKSSIAVIRDIAL